MSLKDDLTALKQLSKVPRTEEDMVEVYRIFNEENDLSTALICGTLLEDATEQLLLAHMISLSSDEASELFRGFGPLASLSARIKFAYALGLIGKVTRRNVTLMREIRNAVAHSKKPLSFKTPEVKAVCSRLKAREQFPDSTGTELDEFELISSEPKVRFVAMAIVIFYQMRRAADSSTRPQPASLP